MVMDSPDLWWCDVPQLVAMPFLLLQQNRTRIIRTAACTQVLCWDSSSLELLEEELSVYRKLIDRHVGGTWEHCPVLVTSF